MAGFTLIEVLVALAVLAIALGALIRGGTSTAANAAYLSDKTFAHWVGLNLIAEQQLEASWPAVGKRKGDTELAGREWNWERSVESTEDGDMRRLTVQVGRREIADGTATVNAMITLVAYLPRPAAGG